MQLKGVAIFPLPYEYGTNTHGVLVHARRVPARMEIFTHNGLGGSYHRLALHGIVMLPNQVSQVATTTQRLWHCHRVLLQTWSPVGIFQTIAIVFYYSICTIACVLDALLVDHNPRKVGWTPPSKRFTPQWFVPARGNCGCMQRVNNRGGNHCAR